MVNSLHIPSPNEDKGTNGWHIAPRLYSKDINKQGKKENDE